MIESIKAKVSSVQSIVLIDLELEKQSNETKKLRSQDCNGGSDVVVSTFSNGPRGPSSNPAAY